MQNALKILEAAISDVGYWTWWTEAEGVFQIEFSWVTIYVEPQQKDKPPSNGIALQFNKPIFIALLQKTNTEKPLPPDWFDKLAKDEIEPLNISDGYITLTEIDALHRIWQESENTIYRIGNEDEIRNTDNKAFIAFWAGPVGIVVIADSVKILSHSGEIRMGEIEERCLRWWDYWKEYWERRDTDDPMLYDVLCEITIPINEE